MAPAGPGTARGTDGPADTLGPAGTGLAVGTVVIAAGLLSFGASRILGAEGAATILVAAALAGVSASWVASHRSSRKTASRSAEFLRLADGLDTGVCLLGADERWIWVNRKLAAFLGVSREELIGQSPFGFLDDDNRTILREAIERKRLGDYSSYELAVTTGAGRRRVLRITPVPLVGEALGLGASMTIVNDADAAGDDARTTAPEHLLRAILDNAPDGALIIENRRIVLANHRMAELGGYTLEELAERDPFEFIHPVDHGLVEDACDTRGSGAIRRSTWEFRAKRKDGTTGWLRDFVVPISWHGREATLHFCVDISRQREESERRDARERRWRALFDHAPTMLLALDAGGRLEEASRRWYRTIGRERDEALGQPITQFLDEASARLWNERVLPDLESGRSVDAVRCRVAGRDGAVVEVRLSATREPPSGGCDGGFLVALESIGEHERLEAQGRHAQRLEALGTLAGGIAHDFNNILFAILGYADMALEQAPEDGSLRTDLEEILQAARRARELVNQIVTFARDDDGEARPLDPRPIVRESLKLLRATAPATIRLHEDVDSELPTIIAHPAALHQVLVNLFTNAIEAMDEQGDLTVTLRALETHEGPAVLFAIEDTGRGIAEEIRPRIFEPYFTTRPVGAGSGLGLTVVQGIVEELGGSISVSSTPDKGTRFEIVLPAMRPSTATPPSRDEQAGDKVTGRGEHVLLVDDERALIEMLSTMLRSAGYTVEAHTDPRQALTSFRRTPGRFDVVITDQTMPELTGDMLAREILAIRPDVPIVLCTGFSEKVDEERARELGIGGFLMKPFAMKDLTSLIDSLNRKHATGLSS